MIEELWRSLEHAAPATVHRRVDATHPLELYAELEPPGTPGLILFCPGEPPHSRPLRSVRIDRGTRPDGRYWLRLSLESPDLRPVFAALCRDIIVYTRTGIEEAKAPAAVLGRLDRWRGLLEGEKPGLSEAVLRGLIGELTILQTDLLPTLPASEAVGAWVGPLGDAQDFRLPCGQRIEVKAVRPEAATVRINGLAQLDSSIDPLLLAVVRLADVGAAAAGAVTAGDIIDRLRTHLAADPAAGNELDSRLAAAGWQEHQDNDRIVVRVTAIERHPVGPDFPRLVQATVPEGIEDADYTIRLPGVGDPP